MPKSTVEEDRDFSPVSGAIDPSMQYFSPLSALGPAGHLGPPEEVEKELNLIAAAIRVFHMQPADFVMRQCSGYSARLTELEVLLHRVEGETRRWARIRTMQVHKFLEEIDRQWKTASRLIEVQRQDIETMRGQ